MNRNRPLFPRQRPLPRGQRGAVLLMTLIVLAVMLISGVALVRSFDTTLFTAGNIAFKRDLVNRGEQVVPVVIQAFRTGGALNAPAVRGDDSQANNYSATLLNSNNQGIPLLLLEKDARGVISGARDIVDPAGKVTIRYVIDRMCLSKGLDTALGPGQCIVADGGAPLGTSDFTTVSAGFASAGADGLAGAVPQQVIYRVSVRVDGPRNTQAFLQTTFSI